MKKITNLFLSIVGASLLLTSCNDEISTTTTTEDNKDSTPTETILPPDIEGDKIAIHYHRNDSKYDKWSLWIWQDGVADLGGNVGQGIDMKFNAKDDYGAYLLLSLENYKVDIDFNFIVRDGDWNKDPDGDRSVIINDYKKDANDTYHIYLMTGTAEIYSSPDEASANRAFNAYFINWNKFHFNTSAPIKYYKLIDVSNNEELVCKGVTSNLKNFNVEFDKNEVKLNLLNEYKVEVTFKEKDKLGNDKSSTVISIKRLFSTEEFNEQFEYKGNDLGLTYSSSQSTFKVWAPTAKKLTLNIYSNGTPKKIDSELGDDDTLETAQLVLGEKGVWSVTLKGDYKNKYYDFDVINSITEEKNILDPYVKATGINGLRGMIVDFNETDPEGWDSFNAPQIQNTNLSVYELHVADLTSSTTWNGTKANSKKFSGLMESGTIFKKGDKSVKTGFDHIKELGVNAVQLLPIFDQDNDEVPANQQFNWGYNPKHYNVLEGSYSSNPYDGLARIREFKEAVKAYGEEEIKIIMDVVYNHVSSLEASSFNKIVPEYYFRYTNNGASNGSGCGNETASENAMMRKFMIDSTKFLTDEYKLGGFRFDLMGLHDYPTMNRIYDECKKINETVTIYGEPWEGGSTPLDSSLQSDQDNGVKNHKLEHVGSFNDKVRDAIKSGGMSSEETPGWISNVHGGSVNQQKSIASAIKGSIASASMEYNKDPNLTVNYVTCHDNSTLYDKLFASALSSNKEHLSKDELANLSVQSNAFVFTSEGISFMNSGEEMLRVKRDEDDKIITNSYNSSYKVNELNYEEKIDHNEVFKNYQKLIELKNNQNSLHLTSLTEIESKVKVDISKEHVIKYSLPVSINGEDKTMNVIATDRVGKTTATFNGSEGGNLYMVSNPSLNFQGEKLHEIPSSTTVIYFS